VRQRAWIIPVFFLAAGTIWLAPLAACPTCIPFQPGARFSDLLISHWPNAEFLRRAIGTWGEIPLWNPTILSGAPFAADPLAGMWYPPNWILLLIPLSLGFNLLFWLHLAWAGWGTYRLLRAEGVGIPGALLGGLAFGGLPKLIGHAGLGHVSLVMAVSWTPWVLLSARKVAVDLRLRNAALAGCILGGVFLIDPRWAIPAAILAAIYAVWNLAHSHKDSAPWRRVGANAGVTALFAAGTTAVLALPLLEFTQLSTRADLSATEQAALSLPAGHLLGIILPDVGGYAEWLTYAGAAVLILAVVAMMAARSGWGIWVGVGLVSLLLSLGDQIPLHGLLSSFPGLNLLRIPPRWLFLYGFALAMLAAKGLDALVDGELPDKPRRRVRLSAVAMGFFHLLLLVGAAVIGARNPEVPWGAWTLASGIGVLAAILTLAGLADLLKPWVLAVVMLMILAVDLGSMNASLLDVRPVEIAFERPGYLQDRDLIEGRIFSPSYSVAQYIAAEHVLELADGVNPLQLARYRNFMASATGFSTEAYSVTLPPFPNGNPEEDWSPVIDTSMLGLLNVSHVASAYALEVDGLDLDQVIGGEYLYLNQDARPRVWVEPTDAEVGLWERASIVAREPNRIVVTARGPGRLVLS
jgi:hypothetical protein